MATNWQWENLAETYNGTSVIWSRSYTTITGTLTSAGALVKKALIPLAGGLTSAGALLKKTLKPLAGALTSAGVLLKETGKALAGTLWFEVIIPIWEDVDETWDATAKIWSRQTITTGELTKKTLKPLAGALASIGALIKKTAKPLAGTLTLAGSIIRNVKKVVAGILDFIGVSTSRKISPRKLTLPKRSLALTLRAE